MNLKKLFQALVLGGTALGVAHCGQGTGAPPAGSTQQLPDGGPVGGGGGGTGGGGGGGGPMGW